MDCPSCGFANPKGFKFCGSCAEPLRPSGTCPSCGFENPPGFKFCGQCAVPLVAGGRQVTEKERPLRDVRAYTPKHLADRILQSKSALEGERKQVTVLFADVKGSLALAERVDPEQWHAILDGFFGVLAEGVHRFEGTVNQYTGDGIMALFGAPIAHEDHAQRACYAALQLRRARLAGALSDAAACERQLREVERLYAELGATGHAEGLRGSWPESGEASSTAEPMVALRAR